MTETAVRRDTVSPVSFRRAVLVGLDDPLVDGCPPVPASPLSRDDVMGQVPDQSATLPVGPSLPGTRLAATCGSVALLLVAVVAMAWVRFGDARATPGPGVPLPTVEIAVAPSTVADGAPVVVAVGPGTGIERVDLFVDGDWTGTDTTAPFEPAWEHRSGGTHEIKAKLTDSAGRVRYSEAVKVAIPTPAEDPTR